MFEITFITFMTTDFFQSCQVVYDGRPVFSGSAARALGHFSLGFVCYFWWNFMIHMVKHPKTEWNITTTYCSCWRWGPKPTCLTQFHLGGVFPDPARRGARRVCFQIPSRNTVHSWQMFWNTFKWITASKCKPTIKHDLCELLAKTGIQFPTAETTT